MATQSTASTLRLAAPLGAILLSLGLTACGGSSSDNPTDAAVDSPAGPATEVVACPASGVSEFMPTASTYIPMSLTITRGKIVRFAMVAEHTATSEDRLFTIKAASDDQCVKFNTAGTYVFHCDAHGYTGTVVVQ